MENAKVRREFLQVCAQHMKKRNTPTYFPTFCPKTVFFPFFSRLRATNGWRSTHQHKTRHRTGFNGRIHHVYFKTFKSFKSKAHVNTSVEVSGVCVCVCVKPIFPKDASYFCPQRSRRRKRGIHRSRHNKLRSPDTGPPLRACISDITLWFKGHLPLCPHFLFR